MRCILYTAKYQTAISSNISNLVRSIQRSLLKFFFCPTNTSFRPVIQKSYEMCLFLSQEQLSVSFCVANQPIFYNSDFNIIILNLEKEKKI